MGRAQWAYNHGVQVGWAFEERDATSLASDNRHGASDFLQLVACVSLDKRLWTKRHTTDSKDVIHKHKERCCRARNKRGVQASSGTHPDERRLAAPLRSYNSNDNGRWYLRFLLLDLNVVLAMPTVEVALNVAMHTPELRNTKRLGSSTASRSAQRRWRHRHREHAL